MEYIITFFVVIVASFTGSFIYNYFYFTRQPEDKKTRSFSVRPRSHKTVKQQPQPDKKKLVSTWLYGPEVVEEGEE